MARTFRSRHAGSGTVACFLFLCLFFCVTGSPHSAIQTELFEGVQPSSAKVDVRVYVTAKSSTCRELLTQVVAHVVQKDEMWSAVNLRVVTLGTSHIASSNTTDSGEESAELKCSGGQASACLGDAWVACIQRYYPDSSRYFPVFNCIAGRACVEGEQAPADCFGVPSEVRLRTDQPPFLFPFPFLPSFWSRLWKRGAWWKGRVLNRPCVCSGSVCWGEFGGVLCGEEMAVVRCAGHGVQDT